MKSIITCCLLIIGICLDGFSQTCTPDSSKTEFGIYTSDSSGFLQGCDGQFYSEFITVVVPDSVQVTPTFKLAITSVSLNTVNNLPSGLSYVCNPANCIFPGNSIGCVSLFGTPTVAGSFAITASVTVFTSFISVDTTFEVGLITINELPQLAFAYTPVCFGENTTITNLSTGVDAGAMYYLDFDNDGVIDISAPAAALPTDSSFVIGASGTFTFMAIIVNSTGCSDTLVSTITVLDKPELAFDFNPVCAGESTTVTNLSTGVDAGATYYLDLGNDGSIDLTVPASALPADSTFVIAGPGTVTFAVIVVNSTGCSDTLVSTVTTPSKPTLAFAYTPVCFGENTTITNLSTGVDAGAMYYLDFDNDGVIDISAPAAALPTDSSFVIGASGTFTFMAIVVNSTGCSDTLVSTITVLDKPELAFDFNPVCAGESTTVTNLSTGVDAGATYYLDLGNDGSIDLTVPASALPADSTFVIAGPGTVTFAVIVVNSTGCSDTLVSTVTTPSKPTLAFAYTPVCFGENTTITNLSTGVDAGAMYYLDFDNDGVIDISAPAAALPTDSSFVIGASGTFTFMAIVVNSTGCSDTLVSTITVLDKPELAFDFNPVCAGESTTVTNLSTGVDAGATYYLDLGNDGSIDLTVPASALPADSTFVIAGPGTVTFAVIVVNSTGCTDTLVSTVTTPAKPTLAFDYTPVCFGENTTITNLSTGVDAGATYYLDFDNDGVIDISAPAAALPTDSSFVIGASGTFTFMAIVVNSTGCSDTLVSTITVLDKPELAFDFNPVCAGESTTVTNLSTGVDAGATYYLDLGNDGSIDLTVPASALPADSTFVIAGPGTVTFAVIVVNSTGCTDTLVSTVTTPAKPTLAFDYTPVCFGENTTITNLSTGVDAGAMYYLDFDNDGVIDISAPAAALPTDSSFVIGASGTFTFMAIVVNSTGCSDTLVSTITVLDKPELAFDFNPVCAGESTTVTNLSTGVDAGATYYLDLGNDGSIDLTVPASALPADSTFVIAGPGTVTFAVIVVNSTGCSDTLVSTITTPSKPTLAFAYTPVCFGENTTITNLSTGVDAGAMYYLDFDNDGVIDISAPAAALPTDSSFVIGASGTFTFMAIIVNSTGCSDTLVSTITVLDKPELAFDFNPVCAGESTTVTNLSTGVDAGATYYLDLGNDGSIDLTVPASALPADSTFVIAGPGTVTFAVIVVNSTGCSDTLVSTITTPSKPTLAFAYTPVCFGENTTITNLSTGVDAGAMYYLDFDNDGVIDISAPAAALPTDSSFVIGASGTFTFMAIVVNSTGCSDTLVSTITVLDKPELAFDFNPVCAGESTTVTNLSTGVDAGATYYLDLGNDGSIDLTVPASALPADSTFVIAGPGTVTFAVIVVNSTGCTDTLVSTVTTPAKPTLAFDYTPVCFGENTTITNLSTGVDAGATYYLDFDNDGVIDISAPAAALPTDSSFVIGASGTFTFMAIVVNSTGCSDTLVSTITVLDKPELAFDISPSCFGESTLITNLSTGVDAGAIYYLDLGNDGTIDLTAPASSLPSDSNIIIPVSGDIAFTVIVVNSTGCTDTLASLIKVTECNDGDPCTTDSCANGICFYIPIPNCGGCDSTTISVSIAEQTGTFCQGDSIKLEATSPTSVTYAWSNGAVTAIIDAAPNSEYSVTVTDSSGCQASDTITTGDLSSGLSSYTIIAAKQVRLEKNTVFNGGIGVYENYGKVKFSNNTVITAPTTFVKADKIEVLSGSVVTTQIPTAAVVSLPTFEFNQQCNSGASIGVPANSNVVLSGSLYNGITIGNNTTVTFTQPIIDIENLYAKENVTIKFTSSCVKVRICKKLQLNRNNIFNPDTADVVVYVEQDVTIYEGSTVIADIYMNGGKMTVKAATQAKPNVMMGLFIVNFLDAGDYTYWYWNEQCDDACNVKDSLVCVGNERKVYSFTLLDADNDTDIRQLNDGDVIDLSLGNISVRANVCSDALVESVKFIYDGNTAVENEAPYTLAGDHNGDYYKWKVSSGVHTIQAIPYSQKYASGIAGIDLTITITVINSSYKTTPLDELLQPIDDLSSGMLLSAYPNPFADKLNIDFMVPVKTKALLEVFSISGQRLAVLFDGEADADKMYKTEFLSGSLPDGMVIYKLQTERGTYFNKAVITR